MSKEDKDILLAKIDTLQYSFSDMQMQAIMSTMRDLVVSLPCVDKSELGFVKGKE